jgi:thioredoxin
MPNVTLACPFCDTLNEIDLARYADRPRCAECKKPFQLDRPFKVHQRHFDKSVLKSSAPVLVDFYADWCGPCVMMGPVIDDIARDMAGKTLVVKVNTDESPDVSQRYGIRSIPFFARFEDGRVAASQVGAVSRQMMTALAKGSNSDTSSGGSK